MPIVIKILKVLFIILVLAALSFGLSFWHDQYERDKRRDAELEFSSGVNTPWKFINDYDDLQILTKQGKTGIRKVNLSNNYQMVFQMNPDFSLSGLVIFEQKCEPKTVIVTSKKYPDGSPKKLVCREDGSGLYYAAVIRKDSYDFVWEEDLDGFYFREDLSEWDFSVLKKEVTLSKAKPQTNN